MPKVSILLAAYNSEKYIAELMESILLGSFEDIELFVRDDCSADSTLEIIGDFARGDARVKIIENRVRSGGAANNFFELLIGCGGEYIMFADADDVWNKDKVEKTLTAMIRAENEAGKNVPILVHSDLSVVDEKLNVLGKSFFKYQKISPYRNTFKQLICQNNVTGCTAMINRALADEIPVRPKEAVMHDWWCALIAAAFGRIAVIDEPLALYRQHQSNAVGAYNAADIGEGFRRFTDKQKVKSAYRAMFAQAGAFAEIFGDRLTAQQKETALGYAEIASLGKIERITRIIKNGYYKNTFIRNVGQLLAI